MEKITYKTLLDKLRNNEQFRFLRWGDGEFFSIKDKKIVIGRDEHNVLPELRDDLRSIIKNINPEYINAIQPLSEKMSVFKDLIKKVRSQVKENVNADIFHNASEGGVLNDFFRVLSTRDVVIVSSKKLMPIKEFIDYKDFIVVRDKDCYLDKEMVLERISGYKRGTVFLLCSSRLSVPVIHHSERSDCTFIDCGSLLDVYVGLPSRRYQDKMSDDIINKNKYGE